MELTLEDVKRDAKREDFRAGVQMRILMPRLSVRVTHWIVTHTQLRANQITVLSLCVGLTAVAAFCATSAWLVVAGLLLFHTHFLLDYVDGEVARCRNECSVNGAYLDLITDRVTFPLLVFASGFAVFRQTADPATLIVGFAATFGQFLDKFAVDCWYRANAGEEDVEDRYVVAPERSAAARWKAWLRLAAVMSRGLTAFLTYTAVAAVADALWPAALPLVGTYRGLVLWAFAPVSVLGALARVVYVFQRGAIPRRQQLL
jgi:phosphatidylglycerophosphate synthase